MQIWTLAWDTDGGTGASVHLTEREAFMALIDGQLDEDDQAEAIAQLEDGKDFWDWFDENEREPMDTFSIESHEIDVPAAPFNDRERKVLLSVLHQYADDQHEGGGFEGSDITEEEIDTLCERLNLAPAKPKEEEPNVLTCEDYDPDTDRTKAEQSSLPPDPEGTNTDRAEWAHRAILAFEGATGTDREDALADLLCDLMHWANVYGQDFERELSRATDSYAEETQADPDTEPEKPAPVEKHCYTCKWNQMADPSCITCNAETWPSWEPKEGQTITINPSAVAAMADKLGVII